MDQATCDRLIARGGWAEDRLLHRCAPPIGPRNTYSNLAYLVAGVVVVLLDHSPAGVAMMAALLVLGIGSALYHALKRGWANKLDWAGMFACLMALTVHGIVPDSTWAAPLMALVGGAVVWQFLYVRDLRIDQMMGLLLLLATLRPVLVERSSWAGVGLGLFGLAYGVWWLDKQGSRLVGLWGHAIWHGLTAAAMAVLFLGQG